MAIDSSLVISAIKSGRPASATSAVCSVLLAQPGLVLVAPGSLALPVRLFLVTPRSLALPVQLLLVSPRSLALLVGLLRHRTLYCSISDLTGPASLQALPAFDSSFISQHRPLQRNHQLLQQNVRRPWLFALSWSCSSS